MTGLLVGATLLLITIGAPAYTHFGLISTDRPWLTAPPPLVVFGILYLLYDKWLWRLPLLGSGIPNLSGKWRGHVTFEDSPDPALDCAVEIRQTWSRISVSFYGVRDGQKQTHSSVIMAALNSMENTGGLRYEYLVFPAPGVKNHSCAIGTAHLLLDDSNPKKLIGDYHNQPQNTEAGPVRRFGKYSIERE
jgi:hypothetical protein